MSLRAQNHLTIMADRAKTSPLEQRRAEYERWLSNATNRELTDAVERARLTSVNPKEHHAD